MSINVISMDVEISQFAEILERYLTKATRIPPEIGPAKVLGREEPSLLGVTGLVHVRNEEYQGCIYISSGLDFFSGFAKAINPVVQTGIGLLRDTAGEMANTLAGNAQQILGEDLKVSHPMIIMGVNSQLHVEQTKYQIPFKWNGRHGRLFVALSKI